ncbi:cytochrome P450 [Sciscionella marina]|uniref:cytochrome P450 n=1 Tax=Sciscionella marina TaxID=508770 RepID=UPI0012F6944B|nr:cytochrome P450 [Sciscionella marina]
MMNWRKYVHELTDDQVDSDFDHHSSEYAERNDELLKELREKCPVAWSENHGGYFVVTSYDTVSTAAKDWATYSSGNDEGAGPKQGGLHPTNPHKNGIQEEDPPKHLEIRKPLNKYFSRTAVKELEPEIRQYASWAIDQVIESGECDLSTDVFTTVTALVTNKLLGLPLNEASKHAEAMHDILKIPPGSSERAAAEELLQWSLGQFREAALARREDPSDDIISAIATMKVGGDLLPLEEVVGGSYLFMSGGVDTTSALLSNTFVYLDKNPDLRRQLMENPNMLEGACEEFIRYFSPVQGLARTVTKDCTLGAQSLSTDDRVLLSFAGANMDATVFEEPESVQIARRPNPHVGFGAGVHRCIGKHVASSMFCITVEQVFARMLDLRIDHEKSRRYQSLGIINGWDSVWARFTPGTRVTTTTVL